MSYTDGARTEDRMARSHATEEHTLGGVPHAHVPAPGMEWLVSARSLVEDHALNERPNTAVRAATMQQMQRTYGNRAVQRFLNRAATPSQVNLGMAPLPAQSQVAVQRQHEGLYPPINNTGYWPPLSFGSPLSFGNIGKRPLPQRYIDSDGDWAMGTPPTHNKGTSPSLPFGNKAASPFKPQLEFGDEQSYKGAGYDFGENSIVGELGGMTGKDENWEVRGGVTPAYKNSPNFNLKNLGVGQLSIDLKLGDYGLGLGYDLMNKEVSANFNSGKKLKVGAKYNIAEGAGSANVSYKPRKDREFTGAVSGDKGGNFGMSMGFGSPYIPMSGQYNRDIASQMPKSLSPFGAGGSIDKMQHADSQLDAIKAVPGVISDLTKPRSPWGAGAYFNLNDEGWGAGLYGQYTFPTKQKPRRPKSNKLGWPGGGVW